MACIFCGSTDLTKFNTIEHIISESLGNKHYTFEKGDLCDDCNTRFFEFEKIALEASVIGMERAWLAIPTKKNNPALGLPTSSEISVEIRGDRAFRPGYIVLKLQDDIPITDVYPQTGTFGFVVDPPTESQSIAISKLLPKMGIEAIFQSQGEV